MSVSLQPKVRCDPCPLTHGDEVKMGDTVLSFHIHTGTDTCDGCEPGQIIAHLSRHKRDETTGVHAHIDKKLVNTSAILYTSLNCFTMNQLQLMLFCNTCMFQELFSVKKTRRFKDRRN